MRLISENLSAYGLNSICPNLANIYTSLNYLCSFGPNVLHLSSKSVIIGIHARLVPIISRPGRGVSCTDQIVEIIVLYDGLDKLRFFLDKLCM